jgi:hypothetical protein
MKRLALALVLVGACSSASVPVSRPAVTLSEGVVDVSTSSWLAGEVTIDIGNVGEFGHTLVITDSDGSVVASTGLIPSAGVDTLKADLPPGQYQLSCRIVSTLPDGTLLDHYQAGMMANIEVLEG